MPHTSPKIREDINQGKYMRFVVDDRHDSEGKHVRRTFRAHEDVDADIHAQAMLSQAIRRQTRKLKDGELRDTAKALEILASLASRQKVARYYVDRNSTDGQELSSAARRATWRAATRSALTAESGGEQRSRYRELTAG
tara:strand:- start:638 stop:1054 length:417 start_codon:yes stop_codon:yes gene_type:complete